MRFLKIRVKNVMTRQVILGVQFEQIPRKMLVSSSYNILRARRPAKYDPSHNREHFSIE